MGAHILFSVDIPILDRSIQKGAFFRERALITYYTGCHFLQVQESPLTTRSLTRDQPENSDVPSELPRGRQELRSELKDARRRQQRLQSDIAMLEERLRQAQTDDRGSKAVLLEEKEALLEELGRLDSLFQSEDKKVNVAIFCLQNGPDFPEHYTRA